MTFSGTDLLLAWLLDAVIGDPAWLPWPHPVVWVGQAIQALEKRLYSRESNSFSLFLRGAALWCCVAAGILLGGGLVWVAATQLHPWLGRAVGVYWAYACLATKDLSREASAIGRRLKNNDVEQARILLARIVGRETEHLSPSEIARATVETVAENTSDGVVAPLFYLALGGALGFGPLLGLVYKRINTMDSMLGYRTSRYEHFGKAAARMDDVANWVPARLTALLAAASAHVLWRNGAVALGTARRDGHLHKSPNSGFPEAAFAGALGVQLGGDNVYGGVVRSSPRLGDPGAPLDAHQVARAVSLLWWTSAAAALSMLSLFAF